MFTLTIENTKIFCLFLRTLRIVFKKYHQQLRIVFKNYHKQLFFENGPSLFCMVHDETKSTLLFVMLFKFHSIMSEWERKRKRERERERERERVHPVGLIDVEVTCKDEGMSEMDL